MSTLCWPRRQGEQMHGHCWRRVICPTPGNPWRIGETGGLQRLLMHCGGLPARRESCQQNTFMLGMFLSAGVQAGSAPSCSQSGKNTPARLQASQWKESRVMVWTGRDVSSLTTRCPAAPPSASRPVQNAAVILRPVAFENLHISSLFGMHLPQAFSEDFALCPAVPPSTAVG